MKHPVNLLHHEQATFSERMADRVASLVGSWRFILIQTAIVICWISLNIFGMAHHWDPYPFILLNLLFSTQAAYAAPILQLSGNRQSQKDRRTLEHTFEDTQRLITTLDHNTKATLRMAKHFEVELDDLLDGRGVSLLESQGDQDVIQRDH